jgi:hypothetical protein
MDNSGELLKEFLEWLSLHRYRHLRERKFHYIISKDRRAAIIYLIDEWNEYLRNRMQMSQIEDTYFLNYGVYCSFNPETGISFSVVKIENPILSGHSKDFRFPTRKVVKIIPLEARNSEEMVHERKYELEITIPNALEESRKNKVFKKVKNFLEILSCIFGYHDQFLKEHRINIFKEEPFIPFYEESCP